MKNKQANPRQISNLNYFMYIKLSFYTLVTWQESYFIIWYTFDVTFEFTDWFRWEWKQWCSPIKAVFFTNQQFHKSLKIQQQIIYTNTAEFDGVKDNYLYLNHVLQINKPFEKNASSATDNVYLATTHSNNNKWS